MRKPDDELDDITSEVSTIIEQVEDIDIPNIKITVNEPVVVETPVQEPVQVVEAEPQVETMEEARKRFCREGFQSYCGH